MMSLTALCVLSLSYFTAINGQFCLFNKCAAEREEPWSYCGKNGPLFWGVRYPDCYGRNQSPININRGSAVQDANLAKLELINYDQPITQGIIENNGHTIQVAPQDGVNRTISVNGYTYYLRQFHFHWGDVNHRGSEHTIDYSRYAMEMHLVHMNSSNSIAVVGIFLQEQDNNNEELQKLVNQFSDVKYKDDRTALESGLILNNLLPANPTSFYRYQGSLTTPACSEGVIWSVVPNPIPVGRAQMKQFRQLYSVKRDEATENCKLVNNNRPLQLQNTNQVFASQ